VIGEEVRRSPVDGTVADLKRVYQVAEVRRCDAVPEDFGTSRCTGKTENFFNDGVGKSSLAGDIPGRKV